MKKIVVIFGMMLLIFACKQNKPGVVDILKINSISVDGKVLSTNELKDGSAKVDYRDGEFELLIDAEIANVKAMLKVGNSEKEITENVINHLPFAATANEDVDCKITFTGDALGTVEYKFKAYKLVKNDEEVPHLISLKVAGKEIVASDIKDEMSLSLSSLTERLPVEYKTDKECTVRFSPALNEGMLVAPFGTTTEFHINLKGKVKKTYKLSVYVENGNVTSSELSLTFLKVNGGEIKPIEEVNRLHIAYDAPYNIAIEALANNGVTPKFSPELQNGKVGVGFNSGVQEVKIHLEKEGFISRSYSVVIERAKEKPELKRLTVNGHVVEIKDEMNVETSYSKQDVSIEAVGKFGTSVQFNPNLTNGKIAIGEGATKRIDITVTKPGLSPQIYTLNLTRAARPTSPRPSKVESVMIASGLGATSNFEELSTRFPNEDETVKYGVVLTEYTLKVERLNENDDIELKKIVVKKEGNQETTEEKDVAVAKTEGATLFYNITLTDRDANKSSIDKFKLVIKENGMQKKEVEFNLCFEGSYAQAFKHPIAKLDNGVEFEPLLTKMNYLNKKGKLYLLLLAYDPLSKVTQNNGQDFSNFSIDILDDYVVEVPFVLTTCTGREVKSHVSFKVASGKERCLLDYLKFYPETPDIYNGNFLVYGNLPSPRFRPEDNNYKLELNPGDWELFFDCAPTIKEASMRVLINGSEIGQVEYYKSEKGEIKLYKLGIKPNEIKTISIRLVSDVDSSIENVYKIDVISPDDASVATFKATFHDSNNKELKTLPAIKKKERGIRLPPQEHTDGEISMKLEAKTDGVKFVAQQWLVEFNEKGNAQIKEKYDLPLDSNNRAVIRTPVGMTFIAVQAKARNGFSTETKVYEIYKFSPTNKVYFELGSAREGASLTRIDMSDWQAIISLSASAPITFRGHVGSGTEGKFAIATYEDYQASKPIKPIAKGDFKEFTIPNDPKLMIVGVVMPDNATLYYALFIK